MVTLVAKGHASAHWGSGGLDVAAPADADTPAEGVVTLAGLDHPYRFLAPDVAPVGGVAPRAARRGTSPPARGDHDAPIRRVPTAIGGTRRVAIVPAAQGGLAADADEVLVVAGPPRSTAGAAVADSLGRKSVSMGADGRAASSASRWTSWTACRTATTSTRSTSPVGWMTPRSGVATSPGSQQRSRRQRAGAAAAWPYPQSPPREPRRACYFRGPPGAGAVRGAPRPRHARASAVGAPSWLPRGASAPAGGRVQLGESMARIVDGGQRDRRDRSSRSIRA